MLGVRQICFQAEDVKGMVETLLPEPEQGEEETPAHASARELMTQIGKTERQAVGHPDYTGAAFSRHFRA